MKNKNFIPVLGTAMWGWNITQADAYKLIDKFFMLGGQYIDIATNYPIDKNPNHFGLAHKWLHDWYLNNHTLKPQIIYKFGALYNDGRSDNDLSSKVIKNTSESLYETYGVALNTLSIHWDNSDDSTQVNQIISDLTESCSKYNIEAGLSGILHPDLYFEALQSIGTKSLKIQVKNNPLHQKALAHYKQFTGYADFFAYGLNAGGLKLSGQYENDSTAKMRNSEIDNDLSYFKGLIEKLRILPSPPTNFNEISLLDNYTNADIKGVIIGPSNEEQLISTMSYIKALQNLNDSDINLYKQIQKK